MMEGNIADISPDRCITRMVGNDGHGIDIQLNGAPAVQQVDEAMVRLADHDQHAAWAVLQGQLPAHAVFLGEHRELLAQLLPVIAIRIERNPHKKPVATAVFAVIIELLRFENVAAAFEQERRHPCGDTRPVVTTES